MYLDILQFLVYQITVLFSTFRPPSVSPSQASEKFQTAFDPPPLFSRNHGVNYQFHAQKALFKGPKSAT